MRIATTVLCCIFLAGMTWPETVTVSAEPKLELSSRHLQISVVLDGKPQKGVRVDLYKGGLNKGTETPFFSGLANDYGVAAPPELAAGYYRVIATLDDVSTLVWLRVVDGLEPMTTLSMDLTQPAQQARHIQDAAMKRAEGLPIRDRVQAFQGMVVDQ